MIGARAVAAYPKPADDFAADVKCDPPAERDDAADRVANPAAVFEETRVERIRIVKAIERSTGLRRSIQVGSRQRERVVAKTVCGVRLCDGDCAAARPRVPRLDYGAEMTLAVYDRRPHPVGLENASIAVSQSDDRIELLFNQRNRSLRQHAMSASVIVIFRRQRGLRDDKTAGYRKKWY